MKSGRRIVLAFSVILAYTAVVHADMMPVSRGDAVCLESQKSCAQTDLRYRDSSNLLSPIYMADQYEWLVEFIPEDVADIGQSSELRHPQSLTNEPNSLKFCLSALVSLGLCCWAPWVKRLSLGFIPDWYHEGGPFQIGHSHALMPETLRPGLIYCFIQPSNVEDNSLPRYFLKVVESLRRESQFAPILLTSRGPPRFF